MLLITVSGACAVVMCVESQTNQQSPLICTHQSINPTFETRYIRMYFLCAYLADAVLDEDQVGGLSPWGVVWGCLGWLALELNERSNSTIDKNTHIHL